MCKRRNQRHSESQTLCVFVEAKACQVPVFLSLLMNTWNTCEILSFRYTLIVVYIGLNKYPALGEEADSPPCSINLPSSRPRPPIRSALRQLKKPPPLLVFVLFLVASHFAEQLNERKLNKDKRREGRLIVASHLRIGYIFHKQTKNTTEIYLPFSNATQLSNAPLGVWPCSFKSLRRS